MEFLIFIIGLLSGYIVNGIISKIICVRSLGAREESWTAKFFVMLVTAASITVSFLRFGVQTTFFVAAVMNWLLIIISVIDIKYRVIPDMLVAWLLCVGIGVLAIRVLPLADCIGGMAAGAGILFLLALIPGAMGGGDVKLMGALGMTLGYRKSLYAIMLAFILSGLISIFLLVFKIKGRKDHIPFGPFLALGGFITFHFIN